MSMLVEVAPSQVRRTVFIRPILWPAALSVIGPAAAAQYLPPVFKGLPLLPPHTIISLPVHTAVCQYRPSGALVVLVAAQLSVMGLYFPPVLKSMNGQQINPPQTIISLPVHTAV